MEYWKLKCYKCLEDFCDGPINAWLQGLDRAGRMQVRESVRHWKEQHDWRARPKKKTGLFKVLGDNETSCCVGISEIRSDLEVSRRTIRRFRLLGYLAETTNAFVVLHGGEKFEGDDFYAINCLIVKERITETQGEEEQIGDCCF